MVKRHMGMGYWTWSWERQVYWQILPKAC